MSVQRWLAVSVGNDAVKLIPVGEHSCGPDVFVKLADYQELEKKLSAQQPAVLDCQAAIDLLRKWRKEDQAAYEKMAEDLVNFGPLEDVQLPPQKPGTQE